MGVSSSVSAFPLRSEQSSICSGSRTAAHKGPRGRWWWPQPGACAHVARARSRTTGQVTCLVLGPQSSRGQRSVPLPGSVPMWKAWLFTLQVAPQPRRPPASLRVEPMKRQGDSRTRHPLMTSTWHQRRARGGVATPLQPTLGHAGEKGMLTAQQRRSECRGPGAVGQVGKTTCAEGRAQLTGTGVQAASGATWRTGSRPRQARLLRRRRKEAEGGGGGREMPLRPSGFDSQKGQGWAWAHSKAGGDHPLP